MKQLKTIRKKLLAGMLVLGLMAAPVALVPTADVVANSAKTTILDGANKAQTGASDLEGTITDVTNVLLFLIGAVGVIMLVLGGFKYVTSNGNADQIKSAKNTVLYAVIGIVVAILAFAIVRFVVGALTD